MQSRDVSADLMIRSIVSGGNVWGNGRVCAVAVRRYGLQGANEGTVGSKAGRGAYRLVDLLATAGSLKTHADRATNGCGSRLPA